MDSIKLTLPLFIRLLEYAREDAKEDLSLHFVAEYAAKQGGDTALTMKDYKSILEYVSMQLGKD
jgi:hypothetical protein